MRAPGARDITGKPMKGMHSCGVKIKCRTGAAHALRAPLAPEHCRCASRVDCESTESPSESVPRAARASP